jgi:ATP-dependent Clp protease protease subunit
VSARTHIIRFFGPVNENTINTLLRVIDEKMKQGVTDFSLLISSPGGSVFHGLSAYNYIRGLPVNFTTHNFGLVDSIAATLYCAGRKRFCVPQARFLIHGVASQLQGNLEEKQLEEVLKGMRSDAENIAKVIAENTGKTVKEVTAAMLERTTLNPDEAKKWGLVHDIRPDLVPSGVEVTAIQFPS